MALEAILGTVAVVGTIGGMVTDAIGRKQEADAYSAYAMYQAEVAKRNQRIQTENAVNAAAAAQEAQQDQDNRAAAYQGEQIAAQSASGISLGSKSFIQTRAAAKAQRDQDALRIRQEGDIEVANYMSLAREAREAKRYARKEAKRAQEAGWIGIAGSLLGGAGRLANHWAYSTNAPATGVA